ncbi:MAG: glycosyl hydrolase family protein, partial [Verrucomicrobia bacterium]|nr:glycosyl hydrolase family protein [Verrucomicrobiota bacterium]
MKLVFEDKFDGKELDLTKWDFSKDNKEGCKVADGKLSLEVSSKDGKPTLWKNATVTCKFRQPYGYFEASIRMIQTKGRHSGMQVRTFFEESAAKKFPAAEINFVTTGEATNTVRPSVKIAEEAGVRNIEPVNSPIPLDGGASYKKFNTYGVLSTPKYFAWYVNT